MKIELFDARMLGPLVRFLYRNGVRAEPLLDRARIPGQLIEAGGWVAKKQAYDFAYDVVRRTGCQEAIFLAYLDFDFEHLGPVATAMKSCATVKESLEVGLRLGGAAYEGNEYFLQIDGATTWMCYREPHVISAGQTYINDMTLTVYTHFVRALADENWRPEKVLLRRETNERHCAVERFEACRPKPHQGITALGFPTEFLSRRLPLRFQRTSDDTDDAWEFGPDDCGPNAERLYRLIASRITCHSPPTLDQVARMVDVGQATLKRQLAACGTSYRGLLDRVRFDLACKMLAIPEISLREIAAELGYADTSNFVRSFRRMTGMPPEKYRREHVFDGADGS